MTDIEITLHDARIITEEQARKEVEAIHEQAPESEALTDGPTADIDDVIAALEAAKERGIERVLVNDDGVTRDPAPKTMNNYRRYHQMKPRPSELHEWVEL